MSWWKNGICGRITRGKDASPTSERERSQLAAAPCTGQLPLFAVAGASLVSAGSLVSAASRGRLAVRARGPGLTFSVGMVVEGLP